MSAEQVGALLQQYVDALRARGDYARYFSEDIEFSIAGTDQRAHGPAETEQAIRFMHEVAFDARPELRSLIVGDDAAAVEAEFVGRHVAEFAGVPASGRDVRVPYSVFYSIRDGRITGLRLYMAMDSLVTQISAPAKAAAPA